MQLHWCKLIKSWGESRCGSVRRGLPLARFRRWPGMCIFWLHGLQRWLGYWSLNHPQPVNGFHDYQSGKISQNPSGCLIKSLPMNVWILIILCDRIPVGFFSPPSLSHQMWIVLKISLIVRMGQYMHHQNIPFAMTTAEMFIVQLEENTMLITSNQLSTEPQLIILPAMSENLFR